MKAKEEISSQVRDLLAYFPGRGRLALIWLAILPLISMLSFSHILGSMAHFAPGQIPYSVAAAAGLCVLSLYSPTMLALLFRLNHSARSSWHESASIIASSVVYGFIIGLPAVLVSFIWAVWYVGISFSSILETLLGITGAIGGVILLATVLGAVAHYTGFFIPLLLSFYGSYSYVVPVAYSVSVVPEKWRILQAAAPLAPATVILRAGILNHPADAATIYWVAGTIHAILGYVLALWIWRTLLTARPSPDSELRSTSPAP